MQMTVCDRCKQQIPTKSSYEVSLSYLGVKLDLCSKCEEELKTWIGNKKTEELDEKTDKEAPEIIYCSYSAHDQESWYKCPYCGEGIGSWQLFHAGIKNGQVFTCKKCDRKIRSNMR